jgi:hypothetical protein
MNRGGEQRTNYNRKIITPFRGRIKPMFGGRSLRSAEGGELRAESGERRAEGGGLRAESGGLRAESGELRAEGGELRAGGSCSQVVGEPAKGTPALLTRRPRRG